MPGLLRCSWSVRLLEHATLHRRSVPVFGMVLFGDVRFVRLVGDDVGLHPVGWRVMNVTAGRLGVSPLSRRRRRSPERLFAQKPTAPLVGGGRRRARSLTHSLCCRRMPPRFGRWKPATH